MLERNNPKRTFAEWSYVTLVFFTLLLTSVTGALASLDFGRTEKRGVANLDACFNSKEKATATQKLACELHRRFNPNSNLDGDSQESRREFLPHREALNGRPFSHP